MSWARFSCPACSLRRSPPGSCRSSRRASVGVGVGGFICLTNAQAIGTAIGLEGEQLVVTYVVIALVWAACLAIAITGVVRRPSRSRTSLA